MRTDLPDVTLAIIDCVAHDLAYLAVRDSLQQIKPAKTLILSDKSEPFREFGSDVVKIDAANCIYDVEKIIWYEIPPLLRTSHVLFIQYDGWVLRGDVWDDDWLNYDYIGAPWPWHRDRKVGNGGFSLRSSRLMRYLAVNRKSYPLISPEDDTICRIYGNKLEVDGFIFAPVDVAGQFSFERDLARATFGFHGIFNYPYVLEPGGMKERLAYVNDYVKAKMEWQELMAKVA